MAQSCYIIFSNNKITATKREASHCEVSLVKPKGLDSQAPSICNYISWSNTGADLEICKRGIEAVTFRMGMCKPLQHHKIESNKLKDKSNNVTILNYDNVFKQLSLIKAPGISLNKGIRNFIHWNSFTVISWQ